ncbi:MAG: GNAT family N-acetyltransferase [Acidobacteria bacterium]|nr:MAG: GNAT family N-acetyltransferase [Acidobacteriota bacterium]
MTPRFSIAWKRFRETTSAKRCGTACTWVGWLIAGTRRGWRRKVADWPGYPGEDHAKRAWILNLYTEPEARRCGVARKLMQAMIDWCRSEGYGAVSLHASAAGRPRYESMGFQQTNEMTLKFECIRSLWDSHKKGRAIGSAFFMC